MKKLMIAAAAAAMIGGAYADYVYDFTASLKTTKGKYATQKTTYTVNCGQDESGTYWWDGAGFENSEEAKKYVKGLKNDEKKDFAVDVLGFDGENTTYAFPEEYPTGSGKYRWCYTFKYTETEGACYRVAGTRKLTDKIVVEDCCSGGWEFADETPIAWEFSYLFGALNAAKANKIEALASWENEEQGFWVAGQGKWSTKIDGIQNMSGNIVGWLLNSECRNCCDYPTFARCFDCTGTVYDAEEDKTAAFGTWSMKYNSKLSD